MSASAFTPGTDHAPDLEETGRFLKALDPEAREWTFQTFADDKAHKGTLAKVLHGTLSQHASELIWLQKQGAGVFVTVNETDGSGQRKGGNIKRVRALFADLDQGNLDRAALDEILARLPVEPHIITQSSPGKWHVYYRTSGVPLDRFTRLQEGLIRLFKSDGKVKDLPRVMRLPGFWHQKCKDGAPPFLTQIIELREWRPWGLSDFASLETLEVEAPPPAEDTPDIPQLPSGESRARAVQLAKAKAAYTHAHPDKERHGLALQLGFDLKAAGIPPGTARLAARTFAAECRPTDSKTGKPEPYTEARAFDAIMYAYKSEKVANPRDRDPADDARVLELNKRFAFVVTGGRPRILAEQKDNKPPEIWLLDAFQTLYSNKYVGRQTLAGAWLKHPQRRSYERLVFSPQQDRPGAYNMWRGFAVTPAEGDCSLFLDHIRQNVARGDEELFRWVMGWFAQIFQQPASKLGTSLAIRGGQGTGKTFIGKTMGKLLGQHYILCDDPRQIVGQFTGHLANKILIHADEGLFAGDPRIIGPLRSLITSERALLERKGVDAIEVDNYARLFVSSDKSWVIPAAMEERRFAVLDMGEDRRQDRAYFNAIQAQLDAGGYAALLKYLLDFDLSSVDVGQIPQTAALMEQKAISADPVERFWLGRLEAGELRPDSDEWPDEIEKSTLHNLYLTEARQANERRSWPPALFGKQLAKLCPGLTDCKLYIDVKLENGNTILKRVNGYRLPSLDECRRIMEEKLGQRVEWPVVEKGVFEGPDGPLEFRQSSSLSKLS